jgi:Metal-dependent proteases with possible chaperone activity
LIDKLAKTGDITKYNFPRSLTGAAGKPVAPEHKYDFSFSGVKTSLLNTVHKMETIADSDLPDLLASYQAAVMDVLVAKTLAAAREYSTPNICLCGGVACNSYLRAKLSNDATKARRTVLLAPPKFCTDNAAMVGGLAFHYLKHNWIDSLDMPANARLDHNLGTLPFAPKAI